MCPPVQLVKDHASFRTSASKRYCARELQATARGGHISFLDQTYGCLDQASKSSKLVKENKSMTPVLGRMKPALTALDFRTLFGGSIIDQILANRANIGSFCTEVSFIGLFALSLVIFIHC